jgi:hypothetical protein
MNSVGNSFKLILIFLFIQVISLNGQKFKVDTLVNSGPINNRINLVILADGYTEDEFGKFRADANSFVNAFFNKTPFKQYQSYFNVFGINVISKESGVSHPGTATDVTEPASPITTVNNFFGSRFDVSNIHRLLVATNSAAIQRVLFDNFPLYDQVLILANSSVYGGSGGRYAVSSTNVSANEIAIHEIGHSMVSLIDEYYAGDGFSREGINMTAVTDPTKVKWKNWMGTNGIGIYQHCCGGQSAKWYRPHEKCIMRFLNNDFCNVCVEGAIETIHNLVVPYDSIYPAKGQMLDKANLPVKFKVDLIPQIAPSVNVSWSINEVEKEKNSTSFTLNKSDLKNGLNSIVANIEDKSNALRLDNHLHNYFIEWTIDYNLSTSTQNVDPIIKKFNASIFPNPTSDYLEVTIQDDETKYNIILKDIAGKTVIKKKIEKYIKLDLKNFESGIYFLEFWDDKRSIATKKIIVQK